MLKISVKVMHLYHFVIFYFILFYFFVLKPQLVTMVLSLRLKPQSPINYGFKNHC